MNDELERHDKYFVDLVTRLLSTYEKELKPSIDRIGKYVENLKSLSDGSVVASSKKDDSSELNPRKNLEEEYLGYETKIITIFSVVNNMRKKFYSEQGKLSSKDDPTIKELFERIEVLRKEFEAIERPNLELENPPVPEEPSLPSGNQQESASHPSKDKEQNAAENKKTSDAPPTASTSEHPLDTEAELAKLESEFGKVNQDYSAEDIGGWEFDELEKELDK